MKLGIYEPNEIFKKQYIFYSIHVFEYSILYLWPARQGQFPEKTVVSVEDRKQSNYQQIIHKQFSVFCQGNSNNWRAAFISHTVCINYHFKSLSQYQTVLYLLCDRKQWPLILQINMQVRWTEIVKDYLVSENGQPSSVFVAWCTDKPGLTKTKYHIYLHMLKLYVIDTVFR